jgi:hypothetical protein
MALTAEAHSKPAVSDGRVKDALDHARAAAQELHGALTDPAAKRGAAINADLEAIAVLARSLAESMRYLLGAETAATRRFLSEALAYLEATETHAADALTNTGHAAESSIHRAISEARACVQKISEAVAEKRSAASTPGLK